MSLPFVQILSESGNSKEGVKKLRTRHTDCVITVGVSRGLFCVVDAFIEHDGREHDMIGSFGLIVVHAPHSASNESVQVGAWAAQTL